MDGQLEIRFAPFQDFRFVERNKEYGSLGTLAAISSGLRLRAVVSISGP